MANPRTIARLQERIKERAAHCLQFDMYRPEAHYMRGPGPKYRAKWAQARNCEL